MRYFFLFVSLWTLVALRGTTPRVLGTSVPEIPDQTNGWPAIRKAFCRLMEAPDRTKEGRKRLK
ncbi:MAG: hypothetical protein LBB90_03500 [Tannerella sp.]|nr:hypothetical protein [Tannerella sp.]